MAKEATTGLPEYLSHLPPKQALFVLEYIKDFNASAAAERAGYSSRTANQQGSRLLAKVNIAQCIEKAMAARVERTNFDADKILSRLSDKAEADIGDLFNDDGRLLPVKEWPAIFRKGLVSSIKVKHEYDDEVGKDGEPTGEKVIVGDVSEIRFADRLKVLELIGKHVDVGAFRENHKVEADDELKELFKQIGGKSIRPGGTKEGK